MIKKISLRMRLTLFTTAIITAIAVILALLSTYNARYTIMLVETFATSDRSANLANMEPADTVVVPPDEVSAYEYNEQFAFPTQTVYSTATEQFNVLNVLYTIIVIAAGGVATWFVLGRALAPVKKLSETVAGISENELDVTALDANPTKAEYAKALEVVRNQTDRMIGIVDSLFLFSATNGYEQTDDVELELLMCGIVEQLERQIQEKNLTVTVSGAARCVANRAMLEHAFTNIIENAVKYNRPNGTIDINIAEDKSTCRVEVRDTGIGIPADQTDRIFEPFFRVDPSRSRKIAGAGLGLAIAKKMIEAHGGTIAIAPNPGGGSVFTVTLRNVEP